MISSRKEKEMMDFWEIIKVMGSVFLGGECESWT